MIHGEYIPFISPITIKSATETYKEATPDLKENNGIF